MQQPSQISRRQFLVLAGAVSGATLVAACAPAQAPPAADSTAAAATAAAPDRAAKVMQVNCYTPSENVVRTAENPTVFNSPRILAERFKEHYPNVEIEWVRTPQAPEGVSGDTYWSTWFTPLIAAGNAPDLVSPSHEIPIQNGWCLPIDEYLAAPNQFAPDYATWNDIFYPSLMNSLVFGDGKTYCAPVMHPYPGVEVGLAYNQEWLDRIGMEPPKTWTEFVAVAKALKEAGSGLVPWPPEAKDGNIWPLALQLLVSMLQDVCPEMDTNGDLFVGAEEALPAFRNGLIGPLTPRYQTAWREMKNLSDYWVDGWATADLDAMWRQGDVGLRTTGGWEFSAQLSDPLIKFERHMMPSPYVSSADLAEGNDPPQYTPGDGKVPADLVTAINGPDTAIIRESVEKHGTRDEAIAWLQWLTEPTNNAFITNENQTRIPAAKDAALGPLYSEIATYKLPQWKYQIAWWGQGLYFDNTQFNEIRKIFVAWATGQIDEKTFFARQQQETADGADRYEASLEALKSGG